MWVIELVSLSQNSHRIYKKKSLYWTNLKFHAKEINQSVSLIMKRKKKLAHALIIDVKMKKRYA